MNSTDAVVVGGGLAGITAALDLADAGLSVVLLERKGSLGGATYSFRRNGLTFDNGQHVFLRSCTSYRRLLDRLGVGKKVVLQDRLEIQVLRPGGRPALLRRSLGPAPLHLVGSLARYSPLTVQDRLSVANAFRAIRRLDPDDHALDAVAFGAWMDSQCQSREAREAVWDLLLRATCNISAEECSLQNATRVVRTGLLDSVDAGDIGWSAVPLAELHGRAAQSALSTAGVDVRSGWEVSSVQGRPAAGSRDRRWVVDGPGGRITSAAVVMSVPHWNLAELVPPATLPPSLDSLGTSPIVNVQVVFDRRVTDLEMAAVVHSPLQWVFDRSRAVGLAEGQCIGVSLSGAEEWLGGRPQTVVSTVLAALGEVFGKVSEARVTDAVVTRERFATFRASAGSGALRPGPRTSAAGLYLSGAWTATGWPATMEGAVLSGHAAANCVVADLSSTGNAVLADQSTGAF